MLRFGFGEISGIDLINESKSILPTRNWKLGNIGEAWFVGDTINIGIGQGYISSTPLQLAVSLSAIANKGKIFQPKLIRNNQLDDYEPDLLMEVQIDNPRHSAHPTHVCKRQQGPCNKLLPLVLLDSAL